MKRSILIVEDDKAIKNFIKATLEANSYLCYCAESGQQAMLTITSNPTDIIIMDLGLPDCDGKDMIKKIRLWSRCPIIVVSARSEDKDKIEALDLGADDYLTKPFSVDELLARIRVAIRKMSYDNSINYNQSEFINGQLKIDYLSRCVYVDEKEIHMTPIEYKLLCILAKNVGKVLTHTFILNEVWGSSSVSDIPSLRVFMATLRKKIEKSSGDVGQIQTHIGVGYRLIRVD